MNTEYGVILKKLDAVFTKEMPFMRPFSSLVERFDEHEVILKFEMSENLIGNMLTKILHGGAIATMLDSVGGMLAMAAACGRGHESETMEQLMTRITKTSTVNLSINYLRPGHGENGDYFYAGAKIIKCGRRLTLCDLYLKDQNEKLLATGNGTYYNSDKA